MNLRKAILISSLVLIILYLGVRKNQGPPMKPSHESFPRLTIQKPTTLATGKDNSSGLSYYYYTPVTNNVAPLPLLLYLHGAGESGSDLSELLSEGATGTPIVELSAGRANVLLRDRFVVVAPQTASGWGDATRIALFVQSLIQTMNIDSRRMYCTGVSMGGYGAWVAGTTGLFAAIVPVCGAGSVNPEALGETPVWAFHGNNDIVVPVEVSNDMISRLREVRHCMASSGDECSVRYTRYTHAPAPTGWESYTGHASWKLSYQEMSLFEWLLSQSKS